jgi:elongation factor P
MALTGREDAKSSLIFEVNWSVIVATTNDLKNGMTLDIEGSLWTVVEFQHVKPGKGPAFVRTKLKQVMTGKVVDKTFNAGVKVEIAILEKREMNFLYKEGDDFVFMDNENFDQMTISADVVGEAIDYMLENTVAIVAIHENNPLYIELAASVELVVTYTEPGLQGDRSSGGTKPATVETGIEVQVPLFIKQDEKILVDTRDGSYLGRAN